LCQSPQKLPGTNLQIIKGNNVKRKCCEEKNGQAENLLFKHSGSDSRSSTEIERLGIVVIEKIHTHREPAQFFSLKLLLVVCIT
jgi:hypothetical protein